MIIQPFPLGLAIQRTSVISLLLWVELCAHVSGAIWTFSLYFAILQHEMGEAAPPSWRNTVVVDEHDYIGL